MKNFRDNKGGFGGGAKRDKPSFENKSWGVDRGQVRGSDRDKPMYKAVCSECSKTCEVPFRPSGDKPVFCSDCFNKMRDPSDARGGKRDFNDRHAPRQESRQEYSRPTDSRAPYKPAPANTDETKKQLSEISMKLDRLIGAMEKMSNTPASKVVAEKVTAPVVEKKVATPKVVAKKAVVKKVAAKKKK